MTDQSIRFNHWFQIISNVAIIVGLGLVIYELNQSKQLAWVQFMNNDIDRYTQRHATIMGDDPRTALAVAAIHPADLKEEDVVALDALYREIMINWSNIRRSAEIAGLERPWKTVVESEARTYFATVPGRRWLRAWAKDLAERDRWAQLEMANLAIESARERSSLSHGEIYRTLLAAD